jgi:hypothetical protein
VPAGSPFTVDELARRARHHRAVEAVIWAMSAVDFDLRLAMVGLAGADNQIVLWSGVFDWRNQTLTPNPDTISLLAFFDTTDGPVVLDIPQAAAGSITGTVMDSWQCPLEDVAPAGLDEGPGGRYVVLAPGDDRNLPAGYIGLR